MGSTNGSYSKVYLVVSDTEPVNPIDGLLWYDPAECDTTTTTLEETTTTTIEETTTTTVEETTTTTIQ